MTKLINSIVLTIIVAVITLFVSAPTSTFAAELGCKTVKKVRVCQQVQGQSDLPGSHNTGGVPAAKPAAAASNDDPTAVKVQVVGKATKGGVTVTVDVAGQNLTFCVGSSGALKADYIRSGKANFYGVVFAQSGKNYPAIPGGC